MEMDCLNLSSRLSSEKRLSTSKLHGCYKAKNNRFQRPGPVGRNPYLNFLREFRKRNAGLSAVETICRGAKEWNNLSKDMKLQYIEAAFYAPKRRKPCVRPPNELSCGPTCPPPPRKKKSKCKARRQKKKKSKCGKRRAKRAKRPKKRGCKRKRKRRVC